MEKLVIVDGHNLLFQMFYGMPNKFYGKNGIGIWGIVGFFGGLRKIVDMLNPDNLIVIFDGELDNKRNELLSEYKANRTDYSKVSDDESPFVQLPYIYQGLVLLGIKYYETIDVEADDVIAGYAHKYNDNYKVIIVSSDTDFYQLVNENTSVFKYRGKNSIYIDVDHINDKYSIGPCDYVLFKSLVGDSADNIKGIKGIGVKTASKLIKKYKNIDALKNCDDSRIKLLINDNIEKIVLNYRLIKLGEYNNLPYDINLLKYIKRKINTNDILMKLDLI